MEIQDMSEFKNRNKIAMLIDGDNAEPSLFGSILEEASKYGIVTIRRIYGDWSKDNHKKWIDDLHDYAIEPLQQSEYTVHKNSTDIGLIIDAMDILRDNVVDGFCIVSSDSDFTKLALRITKDGKYVIGIGRMQTPKSFQKACYKFIFTENLAKPTNVNEEAKQEERTKKKDKVETKPKVEEEPIPLLKKALEMAVSLRTDDWGLLANMGSFVLQLDPSFDPRTYNRSKLLGLIKDHSDLFEVKTTKEGPVYVRLKTK